MRRLLYTRLAVLGSAGTKRPHQPSQFLPRQLPLKALQERVTQLETEVSELKTLVKQLTSNGSASIQGLCGCHSFSDYDRIKHGRSSAKQS